MNVLAEKLKEEAAQESLDPVADGAAGGGGGVSEQEIDELAEFEVESEEIKAQEVEKAKKK
jgi:hypothetical protein